MEPRISIITIAVDDLDRAARFYQAMGLTRHRIDDGVAFFQMGGAILGLFPRPDAEKDAGVTFAAAPSAVYLAYNTRSDAEVDEVLQAAARAGGRIVKPAGRAFWGGWYGYFADTEGHVWEVAHNPDFPIDEAGTYRCLPDRRLSAEPPQGRPRQAKPTPRLRALVQPGNGRRT